MAQISNFYLQRMLLYLRISDSAYAAEVRDLIEAARADLLLCGILPEKVYDEEDALIRRAVAIYAKAEFGLDNAEGNKYRESYEMLKRHMMLSNEYTKEGA